jgi:hypothetical protein
LAATCLESRTITFESIWKDGELMIAQQRERLYWELSNRAPSGVTGVTGTSMIVNDPVVTTTALEAISLVDKRPTGILNVDLTFDRSGVPNPTEINAGRFMSPHGFFTAAGLNFPRILLECALGDDTHYIENRINPLPVGLVWIRGMDIKPILMHVSDIETGKSHLAQRISGLQTAHGADRK